LRLDGSCGDTTERHADLYRFGPRELRNTLLPVVILVLEYYKLGTMSAEMKMVGVLLGLIYTTKVNYPRTSDKRNPFAYLPVCSEPSSYISGIFFIHLPKLPLGV
jgi:hypothetical protein